MREGLSGRVGRVPRATRVATRRSSAASPRPTAMRVDREDARMFAGLVSRLRPGDAQTDRCFAPVELKMRGARGLRVIDMATVLAGPGAARYLADFGADVIKVETPGGDGTRRMGWLDPRGRRLLHVEAPRPGQARRRCSTSRPTPASTRMRDLVDERRRAHRELPARARSSASGSRPSTCSPATRASWSCASPASARTVRTRGRPGFATMAEAMSGFAAINGEPDGAPLLPPIALTDEVTALAGAFAVMVALRHRDRTGEGQVVDVNLLETMLQLMGALPTRGRAPRLPQPRLGSGIPYTVPARHLPVRRRRWIAISTSAESIADRVHGAARRRRRPALRDVRGSRRAPRRARRIVADWVGARPSRRRARRVRGRRTPRSRPSTRWPTCSPTRTSAARDAIVEVDGVTMPGAARPPLADAGRGPPRGSAARRRHRRGPGRRVARPGRGRGRTDDALRSRRARTRDAPRSVGVESPPLRAGPQRLLGTSLPDILHDPSPGFPESRCGQRCGHRLGSGDDAAIVRRCRDRPWFVRRPSSRAYEWCRTSLRGNV